MPSDDKFIDEMIALLTAWGIPQTPARLFGYLLLLPEPASLDKITQDLGISKSTASEATRLMEKYGFLRRVGTPGTKRASYAPSEDFTTFFSWQVMYLEKMARIMKSHCAPDLAPQTSQRLLTMSEFHEDLAVKMREVIAKYT